MNAIFKYPLNLNLWTAAVQMPEGAKCLSVGLQDDDAVVWARVDTTRPRVSRVFKVLPTGYGDSDGKFLGTLITANQVVHHIFDEGEK